MAIILHGDAIENNIIQTMLDLRQKLISGVAKLITKLMELDDITKVVQDAELLNKIASGITGINKDKLAELLTSVDTLKSSGEIVNTNSELVKKAFGINDGENIVFANGRVSLSLMCFTNIISNTLKN